MSNIFWKSNKHQDKPIFRNMEINNGRHIWGSHLGDEASKTGRGAQELLFVIHLRIFDFVN